MNTTVHRNIQKVVWCFLAVQCCTLSEGRHVEASTIDLHPPILINFVYREAPKLLTEISRNVYQNVFLVSTYRAPVSTVN